ncbi:unnamed protein product [Knipowitschia caucasica]
MARVGSIDPFDSTTDDWVEYTERVSQYFVANDIAAEKHVAVLLSAMGGRSYGLLRSLTAPDKPSDKTFDELVKVMKEHLSPKPLLIAERFRFHKRNQHEGESIVSYVAELKRLTEHCEFAQGLDDALRDRLVCGILNEAIQKRLLTEDKLTYKRAVEIAVSMETAARDAVELQTGVKAINVNKMATVPQEREHEPCYRCGRGFHSPSQCRFRDEICRLCNKTGHIQRVCRSGKSRVNKSERKTQWNVHKNKKVYNIEETAGEESDESEHTNCLDVYHAKGGGREAIWLTPQVNGKQVRMELDTGSAVSVMAHSDFVQYFGDQKLNSSSVLLKTYTGEKIKPLGVLPVEVQHNGQQCTLDLYIVKRGGPALWGRDWLRKLQLDWKSIKSLQVAPNTTDKSTEVKLETVLVAATPVFQDGIGTLKNIKGKIVLQDGAIPRFHKARPVPYAIRQKVEAELDRLEADGILSKVDWSPWATPIVPVAKKSGAVRVCGDFKITINPVLQAEQYPLPRIEDIFANLAGGKRFTKVDLAEAYLQMEIEEDSKMFLTINTLKGLYRYNRLVFGVASAPAIHQGQVQGAGRVTQWSSGSGEDEGTRQELCLVARD